MTKKNFIRMTTCAAIFGLVGGATFEGGTYLYNHMAAEQVSEASGNTSESVKVQTTTLSSTSTTDSSSEDGVAKVAENVLPSIVAIDVTVETTANDFFGRTYNQESEGSGSGIIVAQNSESLYIATNNHVVSDAAKVTVKFNDDSTYDAAVKGTDSDADLAVVSIPMKNLKSDTLNNIKVATLGDSDQVKVGNQAIAIGNALGYGTSVTVGYISAKDREINAEDVTMKLLQTDAAINPGNSGGALVDSKGAVIGINSAKFADESVEGMGFAIPVSTAVPIINEIIDAENISKDEQGYLGIKGTDVEAEYAEYYNIPQGVFIKEVMEGSPAENAGMKAGDILVRFDGKDITTMTGLQEKLAKTKAGSKVEIVVKRSDNGEYKEQTLTVTLGKKADASSEESGQENEDSQTGRPDENGTNHRLQDGNNTQKGFGYGNGNNSSFRNYGN